MFFAVHTSIARFFQKIPRGENLKTFCKKQPVRATRRPVKFKEWVKVLGKTFVLSFLLTTLFEAIRSIYKGYNETNTKGETMKIIEIIENVRAHRQFKKEVKHGLEMLDEFFAELRTS
jgi:hypothetical protein